jgi:hypothetical protein
MPFGITRTKTAVWSKLVAKFHYARSVYGDHGYLEPVYQHLFLRGLARYGLEDKYTPIQSSANYALLFLVMSTVIRAQPRRVLELGCGQTTLLLDALREAGVWSGDLVSVEQDVFWWQEISAEVSTTVVHAPLVERSIAGRTTQCYDVAGLAVPPEGFDLVLVDGPVGTPRWSRLGCLSFVPEALARDFVVILDDYERPGEKETAAEMRSALAAGGIAFEEECFLSNKQQLMLATEKYRTCLYPRAVGRRELQRRPSGPRLNARASAGPFVRA